MSFLTSKVKLLLPCGQNIARIKHDTQSYRPLISSGEFNVVIITIKNKICIFLKKTLSVLIKLAQTILVALSARNCEKNQSRFENFVAVGTISNSNEAF